MQELISTKVFVKVCDIVQEPNTDNRPKKTVEMYRHKTNLGVRFTCDPMNKVLRLLGVLLPQDSFVIGQEKI